MQRSRFCITQRQPAASREVRRLHLRKARLLERRSITHKIIMEAAEHMKAFVAAIDNDILADLSGLPGWDADQVNLCLRVMIDLDGQIAAIDARLDQARLRCI